MHPETPQPFSREEHLEMGLELKRTRVKLNELAAVVAEVYGPRTQAAFTFQKAIEDLDALCAEMEAQAAEDLRGQPVEGFYT